VWTTHWAALDRLAVFGAEPTRTRVVEAGKVTTAAGVSAGINMALILVTKIAGQAIAQRLQLAIECDPAPPFDSGSPEKAPRALVARMRDNFRYPILAKRETSQRIGRLVARLGFLDFRWSFMFNDPA
jgi:hypothetical protein